ncbi:Lysine-specific demethylase REF6 [Platanthera guangdongensis]|uniref:Lysine-specific demethylase REF6 n=1 Tax=Platanthera guangdongensis TaxID=2320717 RepID=A0ABR2MRI2_9ASPA
MLQIGSKCWRVCYYFPRAYHCGFSHGFNCGEAANIATPGWLRVAKEAAIRRASTNYPPMVSHFQLLYALALSLCSRLPMCGNNEPRSSRLKDKLRGEGELMIKKAFVQSVIENNDLISYLLEKGSSCIVLPQNTEDSSLSSNSLIRSQLKVKPRLSLRLCSHEEALEASRDFADADIPDRNTEMKHISTSGTSKGNSVAVYQRKKHTILSNSKFVTSEVSSSILELQKAVDEKESNLHGDVLLDQGLLSCVTCGILSFSCVAVLEPREAAVRYLSSAGCSSCVERHTGSGESSDVAHDINMQDNNICSGRINGGIKNRLDGNTVNSSRYSTTQISDPIEVGSGNFKQKSFSALDLLASVYGGVSSDSDDEQLPPETSVCSQETYPKEVFLSHELDNDRVATKQPDLWFGKIPYSEVEQELIIPADNACCTTASDDTNNPSESCDDKFPLTLESSRRYKPEYQKSLLLDGMEDSGQVTNSNCQIKSLLEAISSSDKELGSSYHTGTLDVHGTNMKMQATTPCSDDSSLHATARYGIDVQCENVNIGTQLKNNHSDMKMADIHAIQGSDKDSSRMHVFCLQHAMEVERKLSSVGGVHIMLLCHPDYPKIEAEAKILAVELGIDYAWNKIDFREAAEKDQERIQAALKDEESIPTNNDWAVKLGINLYYSASLSKSPLYSKQMPYNAIIYKSFIFNSPTTPILKSRGFGRRPQKKIAVVGKWCGSIWMSDEVHPYLIQRNDAQGEETAEDITNPNLNIKSESKGSSANDTITVSRKAVKRKKMSVPMTNGKRRKPTNILKDLRDDVEVYSAEGGRILRSSNRLKKTSSCLRQRPTKFEDVKITKPIPERRAKGRQAPKSYIDEGEYMCDIDGCSLSFSTKQELSLHKRDICPVKGCGKKLFSHKYMLQHRKVHMDDRPLQCPWKGCKMTFKWAWARTEHIRVHTGDRPYICREPGCSQTFRFVSDFSRHKRKTGHSEKKFRRC